MDFINVLLLIVLWTSPLIILTKGYLKLNRKDRKKFRYELKKPSIYLGVGIPVIGLLLMFSSTISGINSLGPIGTIILIISCFATAIVGVIKKKISFLESASLLFSGLILTIASIYFF